MIKYPKINSVFKRDPDNHKFTGEYSTDEIAYLADNRWIWTEKIDGTNIRIGWNGEKAQFGGRTDKAQIPPALVVRLTELFTNEILAKAFPDITVPKPGDVLSVPVVLFGEGYGRKIQKAGVYYNPDAVDFILFDVWVGGWWLKREDVLDVARRLRIDAVPMVACCTIDEAIEYVSEPFESVLGTAMAEGVVGYPACGLMGRNCRRIITKLKTQDFQ